MNKKIILLSLMFVNSAMPTIPWTWDSFKEHVSRNSRKWIAGLGALVIAGAYKLFTQSKDTQQPVVQDERQKFLNMLAKAVESDIFRLDCALDYNQPFDFQCDSMNVWEKATENAQEKFSELHNHASTVKCFERWLRSVNEVVKAKEVLVAMRDAIKAAKNRS